MLPRPSDIKCSATLWSAVWSVAHSLYLLVVLLRVCPHSIHPTSKYMYSTSQKFLNKRRIQTQRSMCVWTQTNAHACTRKWTLLDECRINLIKSVGGRNHKMCPDIRHLFKDFRDVLWLYITALMNYTRSSSYVSTASDKRWDEKPWVQGYQFQGH